MGRTKELKLSFPDTFEEKTMGLEDIWEGGFRVLFALDVGTQIVIVICATLCCLYGIKRLTNG